MPWISRRGPDDRSAVAPCIEDRLRVRTCFKSASRLSDPDTRSPAAPLRHSDLAGHGQGGQGSSRGRGGSESLADGHRHRGQHRASCGSASARPGTVRQRSRRPGKSRDPLNFRRPTKDFEDSVAAGGRGLRLLTIPTVTPLEGGIPLLRDGDIVGAIGVSGMQSSQDAQVAQADAEALARTRR